MTKLIIDLSDVAGGTHPEDTVVVWSPVHREGSAGRTVSPTQHTIRLTDGKGEREVEPGPLIVQTKVRAIADTRPKEVTVPDQDTVALWELLEQGFTYTPPIISEVSEARVEVREAVARVGTAEQVEEWAQTAREVASGIPAMVAESIADDSTVAEAAAAAAADVVPGAVDTAIGTRLDAKADQEAVAEMQEELDGKVDHLTVPPQGETTWAHATPDGDRLPLGYTHAGRLDEHAIRVFREDVTGTFEDESTGEYVHVVTSPQGHLLIGYRRDGTVEIPGMTGPSGVAGPVNDLYVHQDGTVQPTTADMSQLTVWGSSTPNLTIPFLRTALADLPLTVNDQAQGGERVEHAAARMGVIPALIDPVTIPASGTVDVTSQNLPIYGAMLDFTGTLGGVHGTLGATAETIQFTRTTDGEPVTLSEPTPVIPDVGPTMRDHVSIIGAGKNNILDVGSEQLVIDYNDAMFDYLTPQTPRALVVGMHTNTGERSTARHAWAATINNHFHRRFGPLFIDLRAMVTSPEIWDQTGITPTPEDLEQQAAGNLPPSLSPDTAHLVDAASVVLAETIRDRMITLGWY